MVAGKASGVRIEQQSRVNSALALVHARLVRDFLRDALVCLKSSRYLAVHLYPAERRLSAGICQSSACRSKRLAEYLMAALPLRVAVAQRPRAYDNPTHLD